MSNCLVTDLKGEASNNALVGIGEMLVHIKATNSEATRQIRFVNSAGYAKVIGGANKIANVSSGTIGTFTNEITIPAGKNNRNIAFAEGEYDIIIGNKYNIASFNLFGAYPSPTTSGRNSTIDVTLDFNDLMYTNYLEEISTYKIKLRSSFDIGRLSYLKDTLSIIKMDNCKGGGVVGDISVFHDFAFSTVEAAYKTINLVNNIGVYGSKSTLPNTISSSKVYLDGTSCTD